MAWDSLEYTGVKLLVSYEGTKQGIFDVKLIGTILVNAYGITFGIYFVTEMGS